MSLKRLLVILMAGAVLITATSADAALKKVARRYNVIETFGGYFTPIGSISGVGSLSFGSGVEYDADQVLGGSGSFGLSIGQVRNNHLLLSVGFAYTKLPHTDFLEYTPIDPNFRMYDFGINVNYFASNVSTALFNPYVGLGFKLSFLGIGGKGTSSEYDVNTILALNFGVDLNIYSAPSGRSYFAISSVNSYDFAAPDDRPKYLQIGAGLKYFYRP